MKQLSELTELVIANKELAFQHAERIKRAAELAIANVELAFQNEEKKKRAAELAIANKELAFQNEEKKKRAAEQLALEQKSLELEQFVYSVSHDLKSPLVTVKSFAGMLQQDIQNGNQQQITEDLKYIDSSTDRMQQLLDALLQYSRIGTEFPPATCLINSMVIPCISARCGKTSLKTPSSIGATIRTHRSRSGLRSKNKMLFFMSGTMGWA